MKEQWDSVILQLYKGYPDIQQSNDSVPVALNFTFQKRERKSQVFQVPMGLLYDPARNSLDGNLLSHFSEKCIVIDNWNITHIFPYYNLLKNSQNDIK